MKNPIRPILNYFSASRAELAKVTWPTQKEVIRYSVLVILIAVGTALFFASIDFGLTKVTDLILEKRGISSQAPQTQTTEIPVENLKVDNVDVTTEPVTEGTPNN
ncbi:MAG: preprotein translocase subunit SecE [Candidatus Magasanikbacteria bacterium]|nr:preprotein translocase subunit SecE [Candidatus Magasanikbacteria bacterium]MCA9389136.1 preprotein translocase subunit SecE [Candidatus Magasanikbacteria bacterium]MCA9391060.1 preprotein translocase subunit SecE [Candidatus Magasanikbacteria bacterium]USN52577.1 MAG: preprotein translocase subunit SecE [Candidatus Nomurabacteria bacterium]HPF95358.1 preprotein translocase subunit SecE [bacterium]